MQPSAMLPAKPELFGGPDMATAHAAKPKAQKPRHRASTACSNCRDRRIRCVVHPGDTDCANCKRTGASCVIKNDDERKKPISRAYVASLTDRIALLEQMLRDRGIEPPPVIHPPRVTTGLKANSPERSQGRRPSDLSETNAPSLVDDSSAIESNVDESDDGYQSRQSSVSVPQGSNPVLLGSAPAKDETMVGKLLSSRGHLGFDQISGSLRYFGPTMNCSLPSDARCVADRDGQAIEQAQRANNVIRHLSPETHDYLLDLFWQHYNSNLHCVHREAFLEDYKHGGTQFYSPFLHICTLAIGYRYADRNHPEVQQLVLPHRESTLHREAKYMLDIELDRPGGIPQVAGMLLLANLECAVGRDHTGWLYSGIAVRLSFDIGLHLDTRSSGLSEREVEIRHMALWACVCFDKYWSLFLGRPTSIKSADLEVYTLAKRFERLGTCRPAGPEKNWETQTYEALLDLMEIAGRAAESREARPRLGHGFDRVAYKQMLVLNRELTNWFARLPDALKWEPYNINNGPRSFFVLHQQYHSILILLHRPFARYDDPVSYDSQEITPDNIPAQSRKACTSHAIAVAKNYWVYRQRFNVKQMFCAGMQTAGTACTALVAELAAIKDIKERSPIMKYLKCMAVVLQDMSFIFQPAERMFVVLQGVLAELGGLPSPQRHRWNEPTVPALRNNPEDEEEDQEDGPKRRQLDPDTRPKMPLKWCPEPAATTAPPHPAAVNMQNPMTPMTKAQPHPDHLGNGTGDAAAGTALLTPQPEMHPTWSYHAPGGFSAAPQPLYCAPANMPLSNPWMPAAAPDGGAMDPRRMSFSSSLPTPLSDSSGSGSVGGGSVGGAGGGGAVGGGGGAASQLDFLRLGVEGVGCEPVDYWGGTQWGVDQAGMMTAEGPDGMGGGRCYG
ncbi:uncharacterized protein K452DRAFT_301259 [Aplosporella prunicola CBS 121167]|uniref:Zn(2)-C6 fungal-type domain-containing protein n=1 Tax=Aplosporella prunicola CBS 121167 TaxID=1176127 RepID=A0A6A6B2M2_9PEZI|nr:uncharacterized protein K452DRAFT_301259 [Aplosporella prunicola CBS 121167]KAF2138300.1 hypothetical protein K452DRAFT_301259 [Aplosporella prunicola CBS 121167]